MSDVVLVTGAGGYVGSLVAARYRANGADVLLHGRRVPAQDDDGGPAFASGDLAAEDPFAAVSDEWRRRITHIVHSGAVTRFDVDREVARAVNVQGTAKVVELARSCPHLASLGLVSTVYATGLRSGPIDEAIDGDEPEFANAYEWSKWQAEQVVAGAGDLPWRILRMATVVADDVSGRVTQHNAFHETLKLWFHGLLPLVPGHGATPLYLVTGDFSADAVVTLMEPDRPGGVYHLAHEAQSSLTLAGAVDVVSEAFEAVEAFRRRRILRPLLGDEEAFDLLASGVDGFGGGLLRRSLQSVVPFARQLFVAKQLANDRLRSQLAGYEPPDAAELVRRTCADLVASRWGRDAVA